MNTYIKKKERSQIRNLTLYLKELDEGEPTKPKIRKMREIIKIRADNEKENKKTM